MNTDMTYFKVEQIKIDISQFIDKLTEIANENNRTLNRSEKDFYITIAKHILFFKYLYFGMGKKYFLKVIISDLYQYVLCLLKNEVRYIYVNQRSIIENYTRMLMHKTVEQDHVTEGLFQQLKTKSFHFNFTDDDYSLIKSEYVVACNYIHGGSQLDNSLTFYLTDCLKKDNTIEDIDKYFQRIRRILKLYDKMLISEYGLQVNGCFHREKAVFEYLMGNECLELLYLVNK